MCAAWLCMKHLFSRSTAACTAARLPVSDICLSLGEESPCFSHLDLPELIFILAASRFKCNNAGRMTPDLCHQTSTSAVHQYSDNDHQVFLLTSDDMIQYDMWCVWFDGGCAGCAPSTYQESLHSDFLLKNLLFYRVHIIHAFKGMNTCSLQDMLNHGKKSVI